jgi:hypothetical protein
MFRHRRFSPSGSTIRKTMMRVPNSMRRRLGMRLSTVCGSKNTLPNASIA